MKFKMAPNSLFAVLLRNPWWISFIIVGVVSLLSLALLPKNLAVFGILGTFPFVVTGLVALKRQWNQPTAAQREAQTQRLAGLPWAEFAKELEAKFVAQGFAVERLEGGKSRGGADFLLRKAGQSTVVAAKRYKAGSHGIEPLQALIAQKKALEADLAMYVCLGALSEQAEKYARDYGITVGLPAA
ncbi:MAG: restriction endonuclease [Brachymonas sp.]|nr:restriction endonuclease [Brachymonas sp.]